MEAHSVVFKSGPGEQVYLAREIAFVFKRASDAAPMGTIIGRSRAGEVQMFDRSAAGFERGYMLRKEHFDCVIRSWMARKDDAQTGLDRVLSGDQL